MVANQTLVPDLGLLSVLYKLTLTTPLSNTSIGGEVVGLTRVRGTSTSISGSTGTTGAAGTTGAGAAGTTGIDAGAATSIRESNDNPGDADFCLKRLSYLS